MQRLQRCHILKMWLKPRPLFSSCFLSLLFCHWNIKSLLAKKKRRLKNMKQSTYKLGNAKIKEVVCALSICPFSPVFGFMKPKSKGRVMNRQWLVFCAKMANVTLASQSCQYSLMACLNRNSLNRTLHFFPAIITDSPAKADYPSCLE